MSNIVNTYNNVQKFKRVMQQADGKESELSEEEQLGEKNTGGVTPLTMQTRMADRRIQSYVNLESDFRKIRRSFNIFARKLRRKVGTNHVKKSQTYQYLLHRTIFDVLDG